MSAVDQILQMRQVSKFFPGVQALLNVDFDVRRGEVHALMGENGAGKSTLIKVLTGVFPPDSGNMLFDGKPFAPISPREAQNAGISAIHQELDLLPYLSVAENIFIGRQPRKWVRIDWREMNRRAARAMRQLGIELDVTRPLGSYPVAIRQMVSIARATDLSCKLLVMDEPTSSLDEGEVAELFGVIRRLKSQGTGVIFITHFLDQAYEIADRITVLRNGQRVGVFKTEELPKLHLIAHMLGKAPHDVQTILGKQASATPERTGQAVLRACGLGRKGSIKPFDLVIKSGEVVGLAGLLGSGRTEVARLLFGLDRPSSGRILIGDKDVGKLSPSRAIRNGIGFSPEDRRTEGIIPDLSVLENIVLAIHRRISRFGLVSRKKQVEIAQRYVRALGIVTSSLDQPVRNLSGGNQQKVILARWLASQPRLLILDEPTRGIDVGAKAEVESLIDSLSREGMAILFISSELEELVRRSHRVAVLRDREKVAELVGEEIDEHAIMRTIATGKADEKRS